MSDLPPSVATPTQKQKEEEKPISSSESPTTTTAATTTTTSQPTTSSDGNPADAAEAARLKREARKARILSKGNDRLARITNTGRGEAGSAWLDDHAASNPLGASTLNNSTLSDMDQSLVSPVSPSYDTQSSPTGQADATQPTNPMEMLMQMLQAGQPGTNGTDQPNPMGISPQLAAMMQNLGGFPPAFPDGQQRAAAADFQASSAQPVATVVKPKTISERALDFLQASLVLLLAVWAAQSSFSNTSHADSIRTTAIQNDDVTRPISAMQRWARLGYERPTVAEWDTVPSGFATPSGQVWSWVSSLPLFWVFLSLEIGLQSLRILVFSKRTPAPPSMISMIASQLPMPHLDLAIRLGSKYLAVLNALMNDVALLAFVFGMTVLWRGWQLESLAPVRDEF